MNFKAATISLWALAACASVDHTLERLGERGRGAGGSATPQQLAPPRTPGDALVAIARLEDAREDGGGLLEILAGTFSPDVRVRATQALGRLPRDSHGAAVTRALTAILGDELAEVRAAAAFALGQRGDPAAADAILERWEDADPAVRARLVEAAGRIDEPRLRRAVLAALESPVEEVRRAAATAPGLWPTDAAGAREVDLALAEVASRVLAGSPSARRAALADSALESPEVVWRALYSLARRRAEAGRSAFHVQRSADHALVRLFAIQGLGVIEAHGPGREALEEALGDPDWRVAVEAARGLARYGDRRSTHALGKALDSPCVHLRIAAVEALGAIELDTIPVAGLLRGVRGDPSPSVRAAGLVSEAAIPSSGVREVLWAAATDPDPVVRGGAAECAGELSDGVAVSYLVPLTRDPHPRVAGQAIAALGANPIEEAHDRLVELLGQPDNGLRLAAAIALREEARPEDLPALRAAFHGARGDVAPEVRFETLRTVAAIGGDAARDFLAEASGDPHPWVRHVAATCLEELGSAPSMAPPQAEASEPPDLPLPGIDYEPAGPRPRAEVVTSRGTLLFELLIDEAPVHVHNFLELARRGHYDGLDFHRVVGDFVIQGGCYRGDGNGAGTWRGTGDALRHEFTARPYTRGSLGMPRNEDPDSGGSQFFVTHRPTPHLDGRYTLFGELLEGFEVLDAIEVGDRILAVRIE